MTKSLAEAELRHCLDCDRMFLAFSYNAAFCDLCKKVRDRKRALENYYLRKLASGKPKHSPMGRPPVPSAPVVLDGYVYDAMRVDASNRPIKLTCKLGHLLEGDNLSLDGRGSRICRTCKREELRQLRRRVEIAEEPQVEPPPKPLKAVKERNPHFIAPVAELWPYGLEDPTIAAILQLMPQGVPDWVRADAGQQVYLECLEGQVGEGQLKQHLKRAIKSAWGDYAISLDWRREDGIALADTLEDKTWQLAFSVTDAESSS